jgi:5-methylcytosine-specific restriction endonuclease McrA
MNNEKNSRNIYIHHRNPDTSYLLLFGGVVVSGDVSGDDSRIMITRVKSFNSSLHNVSKKRLAEMQAGTFTPKRKSPLRKASKKKSASWASARRECLERYGYKCFLCGRTDLPLHAHHIILRSLEPRLIYDQDNLACLCSRCHNHCALDDKYITLTQKLIDRGLGKKYNLRIEGNRIWFN